MWKLYNVFTNTVSCIQISKIMYHPKAQANAGDIRKSITGKWDSKWKKCLQDREKRDAKKSKREEQLRLSFPIENDPNQQDGQQKRKNIKIPRQSLCWVRVDRG